MSNFQFLREAFKKWWSSDPFTNAAAVSYYAVFSLPSILVIMVTVSGLIWNPSAALGGIISQVQGVAGSQASTLALEALSTLHRTHISALATFVSVIGILIGALGVFTQLQYYLNTIWNVPSHITEGFRARIRRNIIALLIVIVLGLVMLASLIFATFWSVFGLAVNTFLPPSGLIMSTLNIFQSLIVVGGAFAIMYAYLPSVRVSPKAVFIGSLYGTILFAIGRELISIYLRLSSLASDYGAASAFIVILLWVYYSTQIFFFGAAITFVADHERKSEINPENPLYPLEENHG